MTKSEYESKIEAKLKEMAHPAATAFGLNMQQGGHYIVWFGTGWNLELYQQANARLSRQGQTHPVTIYRIIAKNTIDEDMIRAIDRKERSQVALLDSINKIAKRYEGERSYTNEG